MQALPSGAAHTVWTEKTSWIDSVPRAVSMTLLFVAFILFWTALTWSSVVSPIILPGVGKYKFYYCLLTPDAVSSSSSAGYLIENHLICITHNDSSTNDVPSSLAAFHRVIRSFKDPRTQEFISCYCGNSAISSTELHMMLPIYGS